MADYYDSNNTPGPNITNHPSPQCIDQPWCVTQLVIHVIIFLLGLVGNGLVIWVIGFKIKQKRTVTTTWYLSLAVSDLLFCATLPFYSHLVATGSWTFGRFMCKFVYFVLYINMFSSVFLKVAISVDRCVGVAFALWARHNRTLRRARCAVVVAWLLAAALSIPSLVVRDIVTDHDDQVTKCYMLPSSSTGVVVFRFILSFVFPLVVITVCYSVIVVSLKNNLTARSTSTRPFKVMTAVIVTFVLCWLPYHVFVLLAINLSNAVITTGTKIAWYLARASSCVNPFLYAFMGKDVKQTLLSSLFSSIENAFNEESRERLSRFSTSDKRNPISNKTIFNL